MALTIKQGAKDFHTGTALTAGVMSERKVESHHVFPRAWLISRGITDSELILNRALIDSETNKIIGKRPPSKYIKEMRTSYGSTKLDEVLASHALPTDSAGGLLNDEYQEYIEDRLLEVMDMIEDATKRTVSLGN